MYGKEICKTYGIDFDAIKVCEAHKIEWRVVMNGLQVLERYSNPDHDQWVMMPTTRRALYEWLGY